MTDILKDFVPEGEDAGAAGKGGYRDFVPEPKPVVQKIEPIKKEAPKPTLKGKFIKKK